MARVVASAALAILLAPGGASPEDTPRFLARNQARYEASLHAAERWLLALDVDPAALQKRGLKGKKKLAEMLDALVRLEPALAPGERGPVAILIERIRATTLDPRFHDMGSVDDAVFRQNSTSYLRIAYLLDHRGLDTTRYREEIRKILPRLDRDMAARGSHQRMAFRLYYRHFGLPEPLWLTTPLPTTTIAARRDPDAMDRDTAYSLTHEVFVPYDFGNDLDAEPFSAADRAYLRKTLRSLAERAIARRDADLVGELTCCLRYLRFTDEPVFRRALEFILADQRPDGAWGHYEGYERRLGDLAKPALYLHTTVVELGALTVSFRAG